MIFDTIVYGSLLLFAAFLFIYDIKLMMAPQRRGRVVAIEDQLETVKQACSCNTRSLGRSYINATVRTEEGDLVDVQVSPCLLCMDRVIVGSQIGVNEIGGRLIARRYIDILGRGLRNDDVPLPPPEEFQSRYIEGVAE